MAEIPKYLREAAKRIGKRGGRPTVATICKKCGGLVTARQARLACPHGKEKK